jgi:hypothetical protein
MKMTHNNNNNVLFSDRLYSLKLYIIVYNKAKMEVKK